MFTQRKGNIAHNPNSIHLCWDRFLRRLSAGGYQIDADRRTPGFGRKQQQLCRFPVAFGHKSSYFAISDRTRPDMGHFSK